ncbi:MAG: hypothetical protein JNK04_06830 [Myxococcales bacterium]|nr:hypothetical protein [Myxococcales bacterium]
MTFLGACTPSLQIVTSSQGPPPAEPVPYLEHAVCPRSQVPFDEAARRMKAGPPAIPGDDGSLVRLSFVDASPTFDLVRLSIEAEAPTGTVVLYTSDEREPVTHISVPAGVAPTLRVHAIVRPAVAHGMFRNVAVCFDKLSTFALRPTDREIPLKLEDGADGSAPGQWSMLGVDPFNLRPAETRISRWHVETESGTIEPRE